MPVFFPLIFILTPRVVEKRAQETETQERHTIAIPIDTEQDLQEEKLGVRIFIIQSQILV